MKNVKNLTNFKFNNNEIQNIHIENNKELDEKIINKLIEKEFGFTDFESFKKDFYDKINKAHSDIASGIYYPIEYVYKQYENWQKEVNNLQ